MKDDCFMARHMMSFQLFVKKDLTGDYVAKMPQHMGKVVCH